MTLIQNIHFGGVMTVMTSDTRQVRKVFNEVVICKDAETKIGRISPYCIYGGGGRNFIVDAIKKEITQSSAIYLKDFKEPLAQAVEKLKGKSLFVSAFDDDEAAQILISGFNDDGSTGYLSFNTGKGQEVVYRQFGDYEEEFIIISPSVDETEAVLKANKRTPVETIEELTEASISFTAQVQNAFHQNNAKTVSEKFNYCALYRDQDTGEFKCYEGQFGLNEMSVTA